MSKQRIGSIHFLRFFAMFMVVLVHVTGTYINTLPMDSGAFQKYHFLNRIIRIEAGIFIMITGLVFFYNYFSKSITLSFLKEYVRKRAVFILLPYVIWAIFYEWYAYHIGFREVNLTDSVLRIIQGESYYQLHFIFIIVQLYLVLPIFIYAAQHLQWFKRYMWAFGIAIELIYFMIDSRFDIIPFSFFMNSLGTFLLGGWLGIYFLEQKEKVRNRTNYLLGLLAGSSGVVTVYVHYHLYILNTMELPGIYYKVLNLIFIMSASYLCFRLAEIFSESWYEGIQKVVRNVAAYSFGFYLIHPFVLKEVARFIPTHSNYLFHVELLMRYVVTCALCFMIIWLFHRFTPFASWMFGKLPKQAPSLKPVYRHEANHYSS
ncbi:acyltransferase family protein [Pontibacillus yanchengensis]|uniref:Acyltransferase family protein n=2 Tax=Pontibacillus yanchengensis TaxID=462910 RepID=A0ACC7VHA8_9BACI|nr:acyltransferase [Pontibacillus yanchengensis]MYL36056.1 acyltransferase family protein [Pontibacillus yanchengensis]MYL54353.1 acyltransferase family protein [Pontibacillus yanchengensis]